jgi:NadR type nicotinamide-nucleotide adenylyltransferase
MKQIVIIGGESTGKTTLANALSVHYGATWIPEFARTYLTNLNRPYEEKDLLNIAQGQVQAMKDSQAIPTEIVFYDTDLRVIQVWSEDKYQRCDAFILKQIAQTKIDAFIITSPDIEWTFDPLREHPLPSQRTYFFTWYLELVLSSQIPFCVVKGSHDQRMQQACLFLESITEPR